MRSRIASTRSSPWPPEKPTRNFLHEDCVYEQTDLSLTLRPQYIYIYLLLGNPLRACVRACVCACACADPDDIFQRFGCVWSWLSSHRSTPPLTRSSSQTCSTRSRWTPIIWSRRERRCSSCPSRRGGLPASPGWTLSAVLLPSGATSAFSRLLCHVLFFEYFFFSVARSAGTPLFVSCIARLFFQSYDMFC